MKWNIWKKWKESWKKKGKTTIRNEENSSRTNKRNEFRIQAKWFCLEYPTEIDLNEVLRELKKKSLNITEYIVGYTGSERGTKTKVVIKLKKIKNITKEEYLDIKGIKGEYESGRNKQERITEIIENNRYKSNMYIVGGEVKDMKEYLVDLVREDKLSKALEELNKRATPSMILREYSKLVKNLTNLHSSLYPPKSEGDYEYEQYNFPIEMINWFISNEKRTLIIEGPSGIGKTQGALALAKYYNYKPLLVTEKNDLKKLSENTDLIIIDDVSLEVFSPNELKHLLDSEKTSSIWVLYASQEIKKGIRRIWIINSFRIPTAIREDHFAIKNYLKSSPSNL